MVHMVPRVPSRVCTHGGTVRDLAPYPKPQAQLVASSGTGRQQREDIRFVLAFWCVLVCSGGGMPRTHRPAAWLCEGPVSVR